MSPGGRTGRAISREWKSLYGADMTATRYLHILPEVAAALAEGRPVVALETTVIAHGLPQPHNREAAARMDEAVRAAGAVPAFIGLADGRIHVGLDAALLARFADEASDIAKLSMRDLAPALVAGVPGATTVAATLVCAARAGIALFATGGIGGVHRGGADSLDISADLIALARTPVAVVCAGAKSILDLPRTLEVLETQGVPVVGIGTDVFPAFYARRTALPVAARSDDADHAARLIDAHRALRPDGGIVFANPPPAAAALDPEALEVWTDRALREADEAGITGPELTPFVLARLAELSGGRTVTANLALLEDNARVAGAIAAAYAALSATA